MVWCWHSCTAITSALSSGKRAWTTCNREEEPGKPVTGKKSLENPYQLHPVREGSVCVCCSPTGLGRMSFKGSFQPKPFHDSVPDALSKTDPFGVKAGARLWGAAEGDQVWCWLPFLGALGRSCWLVAEGAPGQRPDWHCWALQELSPTFPSCGDASCVQP